MFVCLSAGEPGAPDWPEVETDGESPRLESGDSGLQPQRQFKTAEMADAALGAELSVDSAGIEALIPQSLKDSLFGVTGSCEDEGCRATESTEEKSSEEAEPGKAGLGATDEQNSTETAKTYKVSCDKRSIAGLENFTVQVLNASQVRHQSAVHL